MTRAVVLAIAALLAVGAAPTSASWHWPVAGEVVAGFTADDEAPFAAGRHRGITIAAGSGAVVRAACSGTVAFAGSVGSAGPTVSVVCGNLRATYQGLAAAAVDAGDHIAAGAPLASLSGDGLLRLGARREAPGRGLRRYVDPLTLLRERGPSVGPLGRAPRRRTARRVPPRPRPPAPRPVVETPRRASPVIWAGLALVALAAPSGALVRRRRTRVAVVAQPVRR